jgi:hypothetical protein
MQNIINAKKANHKLNVENNERLHDFANATFPRERHRYEWWSPRVAVGGLTQAMNELEREWADLGRDLRFVTNEIYTERIRLLAQHAARNASTTNEPAYRLLQILTRLRDGHFQI